MTELTDGESSVFARIAQDTGYYSRVRAQIHKKHSLEESHQSSLEEFGGVRGGKGTVRDAQKGTERDKAP